MSITVPIQERKFNKQVTKSLPVKLLEVEIRAKSDTIVAKLQELAQLEAELKEIAADRKSAIKDLKGSISRELACIKQGIETKRVECHQHYDLDSQKTWFEYRGEKYDESKLSEFELKAFIKPPLFPDHRDDGDEQKDKEEDDDPVFGKGANNVEPLRKEDEIKDIIHQETSGRGRGKRDHTA